jgi:hypothetical protein
MKRFVLPLLLLATAPAFAADNVPAAPKHPGCGATAEECQKAIDAMSQKMMDMQRAYQTVMRQRNVYMENAANMEVQGELAQSHFQDELNKGKAADVNHKP